MTGRHDDAETPRDLVGDLLQRLTERDEASAAEFKAEQERRERWESRRRLVADGLPALHVDACMEGLAESEALGYTRSWLADRKLRRLVLSGATGCGKTQAAVWACMNAPMERYPHGRFDDIWPPHLRPRFVEAASLRDRAAPVLEDCRFLVIDALGAELADEKFLAVFDRLFNRRYAQSLRTVVTTDLSPAAFEARYGQRVTDRLRERGRFIEVLEKSRRGAL